MIKYCIKVSLLLLLLLSLVLYPVESCGGFICFPDDPILQAGENIAFGVSDNDDGTKHVTMAVQINYEGPASEFAWVLPVMFQPAVSVGSDVMFDVLFEETRPEFRLTIEGIEGTTCENAVGADDLCVMSTTAMVMDSVQSGPAIATVLEEESVGPYDYVILEPAEVDPGLSVFTWLDDNGYDQPIEAFSLIDYYARQDQLFLALRLRKNVESGDIQPVVLDYTLPAEMVNVACVPIQLTSIAATPDMPIQLYVLSEGNLQAFPVNYFSVELDDARADWMNCRMQGPNCYLRDMRDRLATFLEEEGINGHAFVTEYAGASSIIPDDSIGLNIDLTRLENTESVEDFLIFLSNNGVPGNDLVNTILGRYITPEYTDGVFSVCNTTDVYKPEFGITCHSFLLQETITDTASLVQELNETVFAPTMEAQAFVNRFSYLTRFYGQLSPETMDKDPFFAFNSQLPDISHIHEARAVPVCSNEGVDQPPTELPAGSDQALLVPFSSGPLEATLEITVGDTTFLQPAARFCGQWDATGDAEFPNDGPLGTLQSGSMASRLMAFGYEGQEARIVTRSAETGFFPPDVVADIVTFMDARVPNQTVPPYTGTFLTGGTEGSSIADDGSAIDSSSTAGSETVNDPPRDDVTARPSAESPGEGATEDVTPVTDAPVEPTSVAWTPSFYWSSRILVVFALMMMSY